MNRIIRPPKSFVKLKKNELHKFYNDLEKTIHDQRNYQKKILENLTRLLNSNSISNNLKKGYVLLSKSKKILKNSNQIKEKDSIAIKFYDKTIGVRINKIN